MALENILLIFKDKKTVTKNEDFWIEKFKNGYAVNTFFISDYLSLTNKEIINQINKIIEEKDIKIILLEGDHANIIDYEFIKEISKKVKKGIFLGDDMVWHIVNLISAQQCDFVLSSEPISVFKFKELGIESFFAPVEGDGNIFKERNLEKIYEVLHFGRDKTIRRDYIDYLEQNGIKVKKVTPYDEESNSNEKLANLISQSKIVINFAASMNGNRSFNPLKIFRTFYQTKGRIQMAGLSKALCISEYCPSSELLYDKEELPFFKTKKECLDKIKFYLSNENELKLATEKFYLKTQDYSDINYILKIKNFITNIYIKPKSEMKTPIWYKYLFLNQTLRLRFKNRFVVTFLREFTHNLFSFNKYSFLDYTVVFFSSIFVFLRYFPLLILKKIINFSK